MSRLAVVGLAAWTAAVLGSGLGVSAQESPLERLLAKATAYELAFVERFSNVVAEEVYVQEMTEPRRKRTLRSDFLFVRAPGVSGWYVFRDVAEVDGKEVRDASKADRPIKLFSEAPANAVTRATQIAEEGARFNISNIGTLNNPLVALAFLQPEYRERFRFNLAGIEKDLGPTIRTVRFVEWQQPTILRTDANNNLPATGLMWIDEATGRVVKTRLQVGNIRPPPEIVTTYRFDEGLGMDVPAEMRDWYPYRTAEIRGAATYGRFRRFQVTTEEAIEKPR